MKTLRKIIDEDRSGGRELLHELDWMLHHRLPDMPCCTRYDLIDLIVRVGEFAFERGKDESYNDGYDDGYEAGRDAAECDCDCEYCDCERCDCCDGCINEDCDCIDRIDGIAEKTDIILQTVERIDRNTMAPISP